MKDIGENKILDPPLTSTVKSPQSAPCHGIEGAI